MIFQSLADILEFRTIWIPQNCLQLWYIYIKAYNEGAYNEGGSNEQL